jgi:chaperonin cofactor prefoldin
MSDEVALSEQQKQARIGQLQQQVLILEENKREITISLEETKRALDELAKGTKTQVVYKRVGRIMFQSNPKKLEEELNENKRTWESYLAKLELESKKLVKKYQELTGTSS